MLLRETIHKTKALFHKSLRNLKSFFLGGYQKLPRSLSFNPFNCNARTYTTSDQFYNEFYDILQSDLNSRSVQIQSNSFPTTRTEPKNLPLGNTTSNGRSNVSFAKQNQQKCIHEDRVILKEKKNKDTKNKNEGGLVLAQKMKEFEMMMESGDVEHELDIEEALHYYSRLTSPVYLDIVDKFFMDMHSEFSFPQSSTVSIKHSKSKGRRLGSIRL
ncbi:hypothetical protein RIF29_28140 [Crotalaria pallida]|uniref:OVATE domain-containing protein n=1 Tax=Crotalaria pallida TaxID=3830 RepID=A0AAN9I1P1_CROPI